MSEYREIVAHLLGEREVARTTERRETRRYTETARLMTSPSGSIRLEVGAYFGGIGEGNRFSGNAIDLSPAEAAHLGRLLIAAATNADGAV